MVHANFVILSSDKCFQQDGSSWILKTDLTRSLFKMMEDITCRHVELITRRMRLLLSLRLGALLSGRPTYLQYEMAASDMKNRRHVQPLLTWSTNAARPVSLDQEPLQGTISWAS
ncbi:hypothetical protein LAZ67_4001657 [Cordylochernes scorpioides]|uniref:Uncharacterized protein n=1 Tax=Cordylochernes scorpioides TaxID=51811 RepID=A0ABY6KF61_9ARAC|nr:hypothetical protein LAZ67_4001657 [Cordylochernes scorpioides]